MARPAKPEVTQVLHRVDVTINAEMVRHALRCHLEHVLAGEGAGQPPRAQSFGDIAVSFDVDAVNGELTGATFTYVPKEPA